MQSWFTAWLAWPVWLIFASLFVFYFATGAFLVWASFRPPLGKHVQTCKGVVAPFFASVGVIFGLLVAFLSNDIWDRNKQAERVVLVESDTLVALHSLSVASGTDSKPLRTAIRAYASAVVNDEWPRAGHRAVPARSHGPDRCSRVRAAAHASPPCSARHDGDPPGDHPGRGGGEPRL